MNSLAPHTVVHNGCGIDQPHQLHKATLQQAAAHIEQVLLKHPWLRSKAASILEQMQLKACMLYLPSLAAPGEHSARWYSVQLMRAYMHTHSTQAVRQRIEQLYEVML